MVGFGGERRMQRDHRRLARQRFRVGVIDSDLFGPIRGGKRIVSQHFHSESTENLCCYPTDLAGAEDARRFAVEIETNKTVERKVYIHNTVARPWHLASER